MTRSPRRSWPIACALALTACGASADRLADLDGSSPSADAALDAADARSDPRDAQSADDSGATIIGSSTDAARADLDAGSDATDGYGSARCGDGFGLVEAGAALRRVASFTPSPEGVAVCPSGDVYVALDGNGEIWRVPSGNGAAERFASVGQRQPAGLTCDGQGRLFVAIYADRSSPPQPPSLMKIEAGREPEVLPPPVGQPALGGLNGVLSIDGLGIYASDTATNRIVRWRESSPGVFAASVVASDIDMANGLAYDPHSGTLFVVSSLAQSVAAFAVAADGSLDQRREAFRGSDLLGFFDGVAVDSEGTLYVASFLAGTVLRASDGSVVAHVASPASLAFRGSTLFVTDYKFGQPAVEGGLYAVELGVCGS